MDLITIDMETYYDKTFSLSRLTTEEYIRHEQFQVVGFSIKVNDGPSIWHSGDHEVLVSHLKKYNWRNAALLAHNTMFDGAILDWVFKIKPKFFLDTLCMARAVHGVDAGGSLAALAERYKIGEKGTEVVTAIGKRREDFSREELDRYGAYCSNDVELTYTLYNLLGRGFPDIELGLIDQTLRMFIRPELYVDEVVLLERTKEIINDRKKLLSGLREKLNCETDEAVAAKLSSNKQFAELLVAFGINVPTKISPTTGKSATALAKKDEGFLALCEHEDVFVQNLCSARLGIKSTLEENRIQRFIDIGRRNKERIPIPLKYYGAHTGRWAGYDKVNFQNLPSRDVKKKALKNAIIAPEHHLVVNCDSAQIEARVLAWLAGQIDVVKMFSEKQDVYRQMASKIYSCTPEAVTKEQRFVGKTVVLGCGYGTGGVKLQSVLATATPSVVLEEDEAKRIVDVYRSTNFKIKKLWEDGDSLLDALIQKQFKGNELQFGEHGCVWYGEVGVRLPNGLHIRYPDLERKSEVNEETKKSSMKTKYNSRKGPVYIWGGTVVENVVQALARCIVGEQLMEISKHYKVALTVHDSVVCVVPEAEIDEALSKITGIMSTAPQWAPGLPVACEATYGKSYGDC
jgi:DNA polymerase